MVTINLLPWRDYQTVYQRKVLKRMLLGSILFALLMLLSAHLLISKLIHDTRMSSATSQKQIRQLASVNIRMREHEYQSIATALSEKMAIYRDATKSLFTELGDIHDSGVCFTGLTRARNKITFAGMAHSGAELTEFLKQWHAATLFSEIRLEQLQQENHRVKFRFQAEEVHSFSSEVVSKSKARENEL